MVEFRTPQTATTNIPSERSGKEAENPYDCLDSSAADDNYESLRVYENVVEQDGKPGLNCFCK